MRILIAGCGYLGSRLAEGLAADGHAVFALRRRADGLPEGVDPCVADLAQADTLAALPGPLDAVVFAAGADAGSEEAYRAVYERGMRNLLDALAPAPPSRMLFTSSTSVYGQSDGAWVDETSETTPARYQGRIMREAEQLLANAPWTTVSIRLGGIYGPGRTRLIESVRDGSAKGVAGPPQWINLIHRDDAAGMLHVLLAHPDPLALYNGVDREPADRSALLDWVADELGVPHPPRVASEASGARTRGGNRRVSSARLQATGFRFQYPTFRDGYRPLIREILSGGSR